MIRAQQSSDPTPGRVSLARRRAQGFRAMLGPTTDRAVARTGVATESASIHSDAIGRLAVPENLEGRHLWGRLDVSTLRRRPLLILNPIAGQRFGISLHRGALEAVVAVLGEAGLDVEARLTERGGHAVRLARQAVAEGRELVIAAGGDGTVGEVAQGLAGTDTVLGIIPLGTFMNVARTLGIPRDLPGATSSILDGRVLAMDLGKAGDTYFLEAAGIGLDAGLFAYYNRLGRRTRLYRIGKAVLRFVRRLGAPRLLVEADDRRVEVRASMLIVANGPYEGAACAVAPNVRIDDGQLDILIFSDVSVSRLLFHLVTTVGGHVRPALPGVEVLRARSMRITVRDGRPLPVHTDGSIRGTTPTSFEAVPAGLKVLVGTPGAGALCPWR